MLYNLYKRIVLSILLALIGLTAGAYPASNYATTSLLATGHWVKIAIPADGIYQLTLSELQQMGFSDINRVKIYGYGGHMLSEIFTGTEHNDLEQIPTLVSGKKLCFYANGPVEATYNSSVSGPYFTRIVNAYSTHGYYLLTEGDAPLHIQEFPWNNVSGASRINTSYNFFIHEQELSSISKMGKDLLGENLMDESCYIDFNLRNISSPDITVKTCVATEATASSSTYKSALSVSIISGEQTVPIDYSATTINSISTNQIKYTWVDPMVPVTLPSLTPKGQIKVDKPVPMPVGTSAITIKKANLDYVIITYQQNNTLSNSVDSQQELYIPQVNTGDTIVVNGATATTQLWNLNGPYPIGLERKNKSDDSYLFSSPLITRAARFVAFDPSKSLRSISGFEVIDNQNIHSLPTPDFIIVANSDFTDAAQALANLHHSYDGIDVLVLSQDQVFNEFSSGTPDAMAIRQMCKMFYDREPGKLKYLLLMGQGTFDNRKLVSNKSGTVITYETDESNSESTSYASDDFYGILDDGSGRKISSEIIRLGVGRLTPMDKEEAMNDVKKLAKYISEPDYGPWRNNALIMGDEGDDDLHIYQAQRICDIINNEFGLRFDQSKAFIPFFPEAVDEDLVAAGSRSSPEAKRYITEAFSQGQYFSSYIGHASSTTFTNHSKLWTVNDVNNVKYPHFPIMSTACCDVARFDDVTRGIAERMMHAPNGGTIAMLTATREVESRANDKLNQAFIRAFFALNEDGSLPTMGHVVMKSKQSFTTDNKNKMMFVFLGDPAMKVNYPLNRFKFTKVNQTTITDENSIASVAPMQYIDIEAQVMNQDGTSVDNEFTGKAYVTLFDYERFYINTQGKYHEEARNIYYPRTQLSQVDATVTQGLLKTRILVPRDLQGGGKLRISLYAHKEGSEDMVNGCFDNLTLDAYDASTAVNDTQSPVIEAMYFDNQAEFTETATTTTNGTLNIVVTDETALSMAKSISGDMKLILDNSQSYYLVKDFATISNNGKRIDISMPFSDLTPGRHTMEYHVFDVAGNTAVKTIDFVVEQPTNVILAVEEIASTDKATFYVSKNALNELPELTIKVTDIMGNIVWQKSTASFPCEWNLKGLDGKRVANGVYRFWATYDNDNYYGGTPKDDIVVIAP